MEWISERLINDDSGVRSTNPLASEPSLFNRLSFAISGRRVRLFCQRLRLAAFQASASRRSATGASSCRRGARGSCAPAHDTSSSHLTSSASMSFRSMSRKSIGASVKVSKPSISRSAPAIVRGSTTTRFSIRIPNAPERIIARLVRQNHSWDESRCARLRDALRPFVDREVGAHAVPDAVVEIEPGAPECQSRQDVDLRAGRALRKYRARDRNMAFQHPREAIAHRARGPPHCNGAGHIGRSVLVLRAAVDEKDSPLDPPVRRLADPVMRKRRVWSRSGDRWERNILQDPGRSAKRLKRSDGVNLRDPALGRFRSQTRQGTAQLPRRPVPAPHALQRAPPCSSRLSSA